MPSYLSPGVYVEEVPSGSKPIEGVGTAVCAFVGLTEKGPVNEPTLVTNWTQFAQNFGEFTDNSHLAHSVYGYFLNGGGGAYIVRIEPSGGETAPVAAQAVLCDAHGEPVLLVRAVDAGTAGNGLRVVTEPAHDRDDSLFKLTVLKDGRPVETFDKLSPAKAAAAVNQRSKLVRLEAAPAAADGAAPAQQGAQCEGGGDGGTASATLSPADFVGDALARTGISALEAVDEVTMVAVPDAMAALDSGLLDRDGAKAVQLAVIAHCELMADRLAVLDTPAGLNAQQVRDWRVDEAGYDSKYATLYWPWVKVMDPASGKPRFLPPSGHMAGIWARNDDTRGVHKAPANEAVRGPLALELAITRREHDLLNPLGINCIRVFPGQGIRVWGARTLSSDPEWRYLNVRRLFNFVETSILQGTNWVVFEPNDPKLWDSVKRTITMFLRGVWRDGALYGRTPDDAFYVKCDTENNPEDSRDRGVLTVEVGIAAVKPAEFVVFRISQYSEGASLDE
ncbi:phage tail sheath subtilisin-like domain-containing protein [Streptomyces sp. H27-H1]|uniref:phage tail sheath family protein n=1 Tax=Streptomyces sp. H27-H1 TaxID=2996461 RepID=UPI00226ED037|nr:phage tail sheath subtilisin-like domain-containing protein [Streptomyces sp. H27-H1]MCY0931970.1 phage tail sheath subtilisin-like domain-containing protein [Streptomyces sp. H27-H1]